MSDDFDLIAELREDQGKGASRRLRHQGKVRICNAIRQST